MTPHSRRTFVFTSSGAAAGSVIIPGLSGAQEAGGNPLATSGLVTGSPKPLRHREIPGFLSAAQVAPHHTAHYGGALRAFTGIDQRFEEHFAKGTPIDPAAYETLQRQKASRANSVVLHELYFDGLALQPTPPAEDLRRAVERRFGSLDKWAADFMASARAAAGWAMLVVHPANGRLYNVVSDEHAQGALWMATPLVVIDTYEHAFYVDYQNRKPEYVEKFMRHIDWAEADRRYRRVARG